MTLSKVVRKGSYQGVSQWGIDTSSEITPSRATARKWAELENARNRTSHPSYSYTNGSKCTGCSASISDAAAANNVMLCYPCTLKESERIHAENLARVASDAYRRIERGIARKEKAIRRNVNN